MQDINATELVYILVVGVASCIIGSISILCLIFKCQAMKLKNRKITDGQHYTPKQLNIQRQDNDIILQQEFEENTEAEEIVEHWIDYNEEELSTLMAPTHSLPTYKSHSDAKLGTDESQTLQQSKYLMSIQNEQQLIDNAINECVVIGNERTLRVISDDMKHKNIKILDDDDVETLNSLPTIPNSRYTKELTMDSSITLAVGYEWITLALLEIAEADDAYRYLENFKENKVRDDRLGELSDQDLRELIPDAIGIRNEFENMMKIKMEIDNEFCD